MDHPKAAAMRGDIDAQRELARCYGAGCPDVAPDPVLACAWRIVVAASGHASLRPDDSDLRRAACEGLAPEQQRAAAGHARTLFQQIYGRELLLPADFFGGNRPR